MSLREFSRTHIIESVFIDVSVHSDDVTSTEGQFSLSGDGDQTVGSPFRVRACACM